MAEILNSLAAEPMCVYSICGDLTESKLAMLTDRRDYKTFADKVMPFFRNAFAQDKVFHDASQNMLQYIVSVQDAYLSVLSQSGFATKKLTPVSAGSLTFDVIKQRHFEIHQSDGLEGCQALLAGYRIPDNYHSLIHSYDTGRLSETILLAFESYNRLSDSKPLFDKEDPDVTEFVKQIIIEFMQSLSHMARAFVRLYCMNSTEQSRYGEEVERAMRHLERLTLDILKAFLLFTCRKCHLTVEEKRQILQAREIESDCGKNTQEKVRYYTDTVQHILGRHRSEDAEGHWIYQ